MGILSKLVKTIMTNVEQLQNAQNAQDAQNTQEPQPAAPHQGFVIKPEASAEAQSTHQSGEFGVSWGSTMPEEENQFNFLGTYQQYFETVFRENFPEYEVVREDCEKRPATIFTFFKGEDRVLVVEIISQNSKSQAVRRNCRANGVPYLRYYHNHYGWWNTKTYVVNRTAASLRR